jgi:hypothetical protein
MKSSASAARGLDLLLHLVDHRRLVSSHQQSFVIERIDLPFKRASAPVLIGGFVHVPFARFGFLYADEKAVMGPGQF